eukprot:scaffold259709_cov24-Prasinocladus_malaysianus.AAC.1
MAQVWVHNNPLAAGLATSGFSVATASALTNPFDRASNAMPVYAPQHWRASNTTLSRLWQYLCMKFCDSRICQYMQ